MPTIDPEGLFHKSIKDSSLCSRNLYHVIGIAVGMPYDCGTSAKGESVQDDFGRLVHKFLPMGDILLDVFQRSHEHHRIVDGSAHLDSILRPQAASQSEHLRPVRLHEKVPY
jgi:hypothetical protein